MATETPTAPATPPVQKEDKLQKTLKALVAARKKPLLLLNMEHVAPPSWMLVATELRGKSFPELDIVLHTPGGHIETAYKIVKLLRQHAKKVNVIVPSYAKSAGTLICLAGENLIMSSTSELGPLDVQIPEHQDGDVDTYKSALNGYKALEQVQRHAIENFDTAVQLIMHRTGGRMRLQDIIKFAIDFSANTSGGLYSQLHPKTIAEYARSLDVGEQYGVRILTRYMGWQKEKAARVIQRMVYMYPSHEFIIDSEELTELGFHTEAPATDEALLVETLGLVLMMRELPEGQHQEVKLYEFTEPTSEKPQNGVAKKVTKKRNEKPAKKTK
jgi:hypothetical protein